jgi:hypothetical protein
VFERKKTIYALGRTATATGTLPFTFINATMLIKEAIVLPSVDITE